MNYYETLFLNNKMLPLPDDILKYVIQPMLYRKNIIFDYFTGDPASGYPILKDAWDAPHLNVIRQLIDAVQTNKVDGKSFPHPLILSNKEKIDFAKDSLKFSGWDSYDKRLRRKLLHKIVNRLKPKSLPKIIELIENNYMDKVRYNMHSVLDQLKDKRQIKPYNFSNDVCLHCNGRLPFYTASIRKYWKRAIEEGFNPHFLRKRVCSRKCERANLNPFYCANCLKPCRPGTDFYIENGDNMAFYIVQFNPQTREATIPIRTFSPCLTNFGCSKECYVKLIYFYKMINNMYIIIRNTELVDGVGFLLDESIIQEIEENGFIIRPSLIVMNPMAQEFHP